MPNKMKYTEDMFLNKKIEKLYVTGPVVYQENSKGKKVRYVYADCDCGKKHILVNVVSLMTGEAKSCGCYSRTKLGEGRHNGTIQSSGNSKHGDSKEGEYKRLYSTWMNMRSRCKYPSCDNYKWYGGRGISVCEQWDNSYEEFKKWAKSTGWNDNLEIDRIDPNGNYEPSNCRWLTRKEQNNNARSNIRAELYGQNLTVSQWAETLGVNAGTIRQRVLRGVTPEEAVNKSINPVEGIRKPFIFINKD